MYLEYKAIVVLCFRITSLYLKIKHIIRMSFIESRVDLLVFPWDAI